jgi:hypothetical protein
VTDNEIIKALECCLCDECEDCPHDEEIACVENLHQEAIDLINRQKANAEGLTNAVKFLNEQLSSAKAEAVKEFAERLKDYYIKNKRYDRPYAHTMISLLFGLIDDLVKEMVGEG